jgi:hypothetical protein
LYLEHLPKNVWREAQEVPYPVGADKMVENGCTQIRSKGIEISSKVSVFNIVGPNFVWKYRDTEAGASRSPDRAVCVPTSDAEL